MDKLDQIRYMLFLKKSNFIYGTIGTCKNLHIHLIWMTNDKTAIKAKISLNHYSPVAIKEIGLHDSLKIVIKKSCKHAVNCLD